MTRNFDPQLPTCRVCRKLVDGFSVGKDFRQGTCYFESRCHGEIERVDYRPTSTKDASFVPTHAFPAERPSSDAAAPVAERTQVAIQHELHEMPEWKTLAKIQHFSVSILVFEGNAEELRKVLSFLTNDPKSMRLTQVQHRAELDRALVEVLRLLHNFVAAALTLVDHTRIIYDELYKDHGTFPDYQTEVDRQFKNDPLIQFVKSLRQLAQHVRLPEISYRFSATQDGPFIRHLVLDKNDLLRFNRWSSAAKKYLDAAPDSIDLGQVLEAYSRAIRHFYQWMKERQQTIHASDIAAVERKKAEACDLLARDLPHFLESGLSALAQDAGRLKDIFAFGLSADDWLALSEHDGDIVAWTEAALALTEGRFGLLPEPLKAKIRSAATGDGSAKPRAT